tara:strand:- start:13051 stop:14406 length:1356 start_codon:yes stop_codon:yes gene_type:complete
MSEKITKLKNYFHSLRNLEVIDNYSDLKRLSRDFYNYSPILREKLNNCIADIVVRPKDINSIIAVAQECWNLSIPLTLRGGGTGNYGQAVPLFKGVVMQMNYLDRVEEYFPDTGFVKVQAGCLMSNLNKELEKHGRELRLLPSTWRTATIGGFIAGGSGGIGSVSWGFLRDPGNLIGIEAIDLNQRPKLLKLDALESEPLNHAYGTNGIITSLIVSTDFKRDWYSLIIDCDELQKAFKILKIITAAAIELKLGAILEEEIVAHMPSWFNKKSICHKILVQSTLSGLKTIELICKQNKLNLNNLGRENESENSILDLVWNHTTLQLRAKDKNWTYLQMLLPHNTELEFIENLNKKIGKKLLWHIEAVSQQGIPRLAALPVLKWTNEKDLNNVMLYCKKLGAIIFNPHVITVEGGGLGVVDADQVKTKLENDPKGLLNPGKLEGWSEKDIFKT